MKAIFQGEFHVSESDRESLLAHIDEDVDALFVEQRADSVSPDDWSFGYLTFIISALIFYWFQALFDSSPRIKDEADVPTFDEIDTPLPELYSRFPIYWTVPIGLLTGLIFLYGVFIPKMTLPLMSVPPTFNMAFTMIMKPFIIIAAPVVFSGMLIYLEERNMGSRDEDMADSIIDISERDGFQTVVVSCGNMHLDRLPKLLKNEGWDVEIHESKYSRTPGLC
jgi:hypothetical protein